MANEQPENHVQKASNSLNKEGKQKHDDEAHKHK